VDVARAAVLELVGLQAPSWCDESLKGYDWLYTLQEPDLTTHMLYAQLLPGFLERYGDRLADDERAIIARVAESPESPLFAPSEHPFCLEHVDYRLDNMLIDTRQSPPKVTVVDWQSLRLGPPMNDVAYFLGAGLLPEDRRPAEERIVRDYHRALAAAGVEDYQWEQCWTDYRKGTFSGFGVTVIASMIVQQTERGDEMFTVMAQRHARHALDHDAAEFLR
jgi:aminoglycoside phosphotransferase (APT) family kinase protein